MDKYFRTFNPLTGISHASGTGGKLPVSGQPFMIVGNSREEVDNLLFSEFEYDELDYRLVSYVEHPIHFSIGYSEAEASAVIAILVQATLDIMVVPIKHPSRDVWAIPFSQPLMDYIPASAHKNQLEQIHLDRVNEGRVRTVAQMQSEGW